MDPLTLTGLAISAAPTIARWLGASDTAGNAIESVAGAAREILGTDDPETAMNVLVSDHEAATKFKIRLAEIAAQRDAEERRADLEGLRARLADTANARQQTIALAQAGSFLAYGAMVVSVIIMILFSFVIVGSAFGLAVSESHTRLLEYCLIAVMGYWVGSSAGSAAKDRRNSGG